MPRARKKPAPSPAIQPKPPRASRRPDVIIALGLVAATLIAYAQVAGFDFVNYDDPQYVTSNPHVTSGLTLDNIQWAFTSIVDANWLPLTSLSHMIDCQFFGLSGGMHHLVNIAFHLAAALLLFAFLNGATSARWPSAFVAFVFALHPLHVESAAWIAERKDVLSTLFWFLALFEYLRYSARPALRSYLFMLAAFCLGLMSKPMLVTFPFTLLLLDVWPLRRTRFPKTLWEKVPLFALSLAVSLVTLFTQKSGGAMRTFALGLRLENALVTYAAYLAQTFFPRDLAVFYPYPESIPAWQIAVSAVILTAVSALCLRMWRTRPYLGVGWFWYLGTLVPVIGLVQVGLQSRADRYTYVPLVGIAIMLAWGAADIFEHWPAVRKPILAAAAAACLACLTLTTLQAAYWKNSEVLFQRALDVTKNDDTMELDLATYLMHLPGRSQDAISHLRAAIAINPNSAIAHEDLGATLGSLPGHLAEAIVQFREAVRLAPGFAPSHRDLAKALAVTPGGTTEALREFETALRLDPNDPETHFYYGNTLAQIPERSRESIAQYQAALQLNPDYTEAQQVLKASVSGVPARELDALASKVEASPNSAEAHFNYALALSRTPGRGEDALTQYQAALRLKPDYPEAHNNLGVLLVNLGRQQDAIANFEAAAKERPDYQNERNLGIMLAKVAGKESQALTHLKAAQRLHYSQDLDPIIQRLQSAAH